MARTGSPLVLRSLVAAAALILAAPAALPAASFIRGDSNGDGERDISDPLFTLTFLFQGGTDPACAAALDANDDEVLDLSDAVRDLGFLFLGLPPLPPPGPLPGADPTPGLGCGFPAPADLLCRKAGPAVDITFRMTEAYDAVEVLRDGDLAASLPGTASSYRDRPLAGGDHSYEVRGVRGGAPGASASCLVTALPANAPPTITILTPAQGALVETAELSVSCRVNDETGVVRVRIGGVEATPPGPPRPPFTVTAAVPLPAGPALIPIQAVDDFGRSTTVELAVGRRPLQERGRPGRGVALHMAGGGGYDELEAIARPFLTGLPALIDAGVRGILLFQGSVLGVDLRVTGNRAEITGPIGFDLTPSAQGGGRVGMAVRLEQVRLFADGRSDYGFLGTDAWSATWTARSVVISGAFALSPRPGGMGLDVASDGFTVTFGSSELAVSGFLDPFGIFDGLVGFLADLFRDEIESQVRTAVEQAVEEQLLPVLAEAFSGLRLDLDLGGARLATLFSDVLESAQGLSVLLDATWSGAAPDPTFPRFPGSRTELAPFPVFPIPVSPPHPLDATISLSRDTLNAALLELAAGGILQADLELDGAGSPIPLQVGTLAATLDRRLETLPGVSAEDPLALRVRARRPPELILGEGVVGRLILGEGVVWRYQVGSAEPPAAWRQPTFDDRTWPRGPSGFGYSSDPVERRSVRTPVPALEAGDAVSLYTRVRFSVPDPAALRSPLLRVLIDDGFVAYLNGQEVGRSNLRSPTGTAPPFDERAAAAVEPAWVDLDLNPFRQHFRAGENVLCIQAHNADPASSDFVVLPVLVEPTPPPAGTISSVPAQIEVPGLSVGFVADTAGDGIGAGDGDGVRDEVDLFAYSLDFRLQTRLLLRRGEEGELVLAFEMETADGPDPDQFPDAIVGGPGGIEIGLAGEAFDMDDAVLLEFAEFALALFGPTLSGALEGFALPSVPLPELAFDLDGDGSPDVLLDVRAATLALVDATGDARADWICVLSDLASTNP